VRYVFGCLPLDAARLLDAYSNTFSRDDAVTIVVEQVYSVYPLRCTIHTIHTKRRSHAGDVLQHFAHMLPTMRTMCAQRFPLATFADVRQPGLVLPHDCKQPGDEPGGEPKPEPEPEVGALGCQQPHQPQLPKIQSRLWSMRQDGQCSSKILYVGDRDGFVICSLILKHTSASFYSFDPSRHQEAIREETNANNRALRGRYFCVEKAKEAEVLLFCDIACVLPCSYCAEHDVLP
jgi:hypothetical protein